MHAQVNALNHSLLRFKANHHQIALLSSNLMTRLVDMQAIKDLSMAISLLGDKVDYETLHQRGLVHHSMHVSHEKEASALLIRLYFGND